MTIRLNERQLKNMIGNCVRQAMNEEYDNELKRKEIDAAWDEFERKPWGYENEFLTHYGRGNANVRKPYSQPGKYSMDAQKPYVNNDASNSADTGKNISRTYAKQLAGNSDGKNWCGLGDYNDWDAAMDDTHFDDGAYTFDNWGRHTTRNNFSTYTTDYNHLDESVRRSVRKAIRKLAR